MNRQRQTPVLRAIVIVALIVAFGAGLMVGYHGLAALHIIRPYLALAQDFEGGSMTATQLAATISSLQKDLPALEAHLAEVQRYGAPGLWLMQSAGRLPILGADVQAVPALLETGTHLVAATRSGAALLPAVLSLPMPGGPSARQPMLQSLLNVLRENAPALAAAREHVTAAQRSCTRVQGRAFRTVVGGYAQRLERYVSLLDVAVGVAAALPGALGDSKPQTYLLLAQNNDELRATGGFLSAAGTITFDRGDVTHFSLKDSYAGDDLKVAHPAPPDALLRYMDIGVLLMRDVNWWPHFPTSAAMAMRVWKLDHRQEVDGVVALDEEGLRLLVEALGPIAIEGEDQPVTAAELRGLLRQKWGTVPQERLEKGAWWLHRKDFLPVVASAILARMQTQLSLDDLPRLAQWLAQAINGKHLQVYAVQPSLQSLMEQLRIDGGIRPTDGDYLLIVDSNLGFNKVNANVKQQIEYTVDLSEPNRAQAKLAVTYLNEAAIRLEQCVLGAAYGLTYDDMTQRCYWDYVRAYTPAGSTALLRQDSAEIEVLDEEDKRVFASYFVLAPGQHHQLSLDYLLPVDSVRREGSVYHYDLLVQKQAGTPAHALRVTIKLPAGAQLLAASPEPARADGALTFNVALDRDLVFEVTYAH